MGCLFAAACGPGEAARCVETERTIPWDEPIDGDRAGQDWIDALGGELIGSLTWQVPGEEVTGDVPEGETGFTMSIARAGEGVIFVDRERVGGDGAERLACGSTLRLPVAVSFATEDGALDLAVSGQLTAWPGQAPNAYGALEFDASHNAGTLMLGVVDPDAYEDRIASRLVFDLRADGTSGSIMLEAISPAEDELRSSMVPEFYEQIAAFEGSRQ